MKSHLNKKALILLAISSSYLPTAQQDESKEDIVQEEKESTEIEKIEFKVADFKTIMKQASLKKKKELKRGKNDMEKIKEGMELVGEQKGWLSFLISYATYFEKENSNKIEKEVNRIIPYVVQITSVYNTTKNQTTRSYTTGTIIANSPNKAYILTCKHSIQAYTSTLLNIDASLLNKDKKHNATYVWIDKEGIKYSCSYAYLHKKEDIAIIEYIGMYNDMNSQIKNVIPIGLPSKMTYKPYSNEYIIEKAYIIGFPAEGKEANKLYKSHSSANIKLGNNQIEYEMSTISGQSGSAIICYNKEKDSITIIGIHTDGKPTHNEGVLIDTQKKELIEHAIQQITNYKENNKEIVKETYKLKENLKKLGKNHQKTAHTYHDLGVNYSKQQKYQEAEQHYQEALAIYLQVVGKNHLDTASTYNNLGL